MGSYVAVLKPNSPLQFAAAGPRGEAGPAGTGVETLTTKGDLLGFSTVAVRIPVDSNGKVLTVKSSASAGVSWETPDVTQVELDAEATARVAVGSAAAAALVAHEADTAGIHGIADTSVLATATTVATAVSNHAGAADPHGDRAYTDAQIAASLSTAFDFKASVRAATTANITLSGAQTIDGVSVIAGNRVLVKNQSTGSENGIYVAASGAWARSTDADVSAEVTSGLAVVGEEGTVSAGRLYVLTTANPVTVGSTSLSFSLLDAGDLRAALNLSDLPSPSTARTNLGLVIGTNVQAWDTDLDAFAALVSAANKMPYATGAGAWSLADLTAFARTILDDANQAAVQATLALTPGTDVQAFSAKLAAIAALTWAADKLPYFTGTGAVATADLATFIRTLLDDADAATARATLGAAAATGVGLPWEMEIALSDETTAVTTGDAKVTFRMPCAVTLNAGNAGVRLSANTVSSSGLPTVDINEAGSTILSTKVTLDVSEKTSLTAATAVVISDVNLADDAEMSVDVDVAGTGCKGLKLLLRGVRA